MPRVFILLISFLFVLSQVSLAQSTYEEQLDHYILERTEIDSLKKEVYTSIEDPRNGGGSSKRYGYKHEIWKILKSE